MNPADLNGFLSPVREVLELYKELALLDIVLLQYKQISLVNMHTWLGAERPSVVMHTSTCSGMTLVTEFNTNLCVKR